MLLLVTPLLSSPVGSAAGWTVSSGSGGVAPTAAWMRSVSTDETGARWSWSAPGLSSGWALRESPEESLGEWTFG